MCRNFSRNMFNGNSFQKSKEVCKNGKSNKKFHCNEKKHPDKYRKNNKNATILLCARKDVEKLCEETVYK